MKGIYQGPIEFDEILISKGSRFGTFADTQAHKSFTDGEGDTVPGMFTVFTIIVPLTTVSNFVGV